MKRRSPLIYAGIVIVGMGLLSWQSSQRDAARKKAAVAAQDAAFAQAKQAKVAAAKEEPAANATDEEQPQEPLLAAGTAAPSSERFNSMPDGSAVPALDAKAPSKVKVGLVLFRYKGAQAPPPSDRSPQEALQLAEKAIEAGASDFDKAVEMGDRGSASNIGWIPRGTLEPAVEYAVFSLEKGKISAPIDTPRGYWVVKRLR